MAKYKVTCTKDEFVKVVNNYVIGARAKRNREILIDHIIDGITYEEVAEKHEMSIRQTKQIVRDCMKTVKERIPAQ